MRNASFISLSAISVIALVAGCSGGGASFRPPSTSSTPAGAQPPGTPADGKARASLKVTVPAARSTATHRVGTAAVLRPQYISPSSAGLSVAVNGGAPSTFGLTIDSPGCVSQAGSLTCSFSLIVPPGSDSLALDVTDASGNVLSRNVVTVVAVAGASTPVNVTLAGVAVSVAAVPGPGAVADTVVSPFHVAGLFPVPVEIEPLDADGNVIIGPGSPTVASVSIATGGAYATIASAGTTDPDAFVLAPNGSAGGKSVAITATVQGQTLGDGTTPAPVAGSTSYLFTPAILLAQGAFYEYSVESGNLVTAFNGPSVGFGSSEGDFKADAKGNLSLSLAILDGFSFVSVVFEFPTGAESASTILGLKEGVYSVGGLATDASGTVYIADNPTVALPPSTGRPAMIPAFAFGATTPTRTITEHASTSASGLAVDEAGNVYEADSASDVVLKFTPTSQTPVRLSGPNLGQPGHMAIDASGGLYVVDDANDDIAYFAPGATSVTSTLSDVSFEPQIAGIVFDPSGNLWVSVPPESSANNSSSGITERLSAASLPNAVSVTEKFYAGGLPVWIP